MQSENNDPIFRCIQLPLDIFTNFKCSAKITMSYNRNLFNRVLSVLLINLHFCFSNQVQSFNAHSIGLPVWLKQRITSCFVDSQKQCLYDCSDIICE